MTTTDHVVDETAFCQRCGIPIGLCMCPDDEEGFVRLSGLSARQRDPTLDRSSAAFRGLAGDVVAMLEPHTEAAPAALLVATLASFGAMVGGMAETRVSFAPHPPALWFALVGASSRARKGTAQAEVDAVMNRVEEGWAETHRVSGFGSGEAFIEHAGEHPGDAILLVEEELARVLAVASREGSSVSAVLRQAYDFKRLEHRVRKNRMTAPATPTSLIGHITAHELKDDRAGLRAVEIANGFGNRIMWIHTDRSQLLPEPTRPSAGELSPIVGRLHDALVMARRGQEVTFGETGSERWRELYYRLDRDRDTAPTIDSLKARAAAHLLRLALVYCLMDGQRTMTDRHVESAWEVWRYARWTMQHVWVGSGSGDPLVDRVSDVLASGEVLTGRDLDKMTGGRRSPEVRDRLIELGLAETFETRKDGSAGRPSVVLRAADKPDKRTNPPTDWWRNVDFTR